MLCEGFAARLSCGRCIVTAAVGGRLLAAVAVMVSGLAAGPRLQAQETPNRQQFFDNLVRGLVDSQTASNRPAPPTELLGPSRVAANQSNIQTLVDSIADDTSRLTDVLYADRVRIPQLQSFLNSVLQLRAKALVLSNRVRQERDVTRLNADVRLLDGDWRVLRGQLSQIEGLSAAARQHMDRIASADEALMGLLGVRPQLDATAIIRVLAGMSTSMEHLIEDIELELNPTASLTQLLSDARLVLEQIRYVSRAVENRVEANTVIQEYRRFRSGWYGLAARLRPIQNRYVERHLRRIERLDRDARELLWISDTIDQPQILSLAMNLSQDVSRLFDRLSLSDLLRLGANDRNLLITAASLQTRCRELIESFDGDTNRGELQNVMTRLRGDWGQIDASLRAQSSGETRNLMGEIRETIEVISGAIGQPVALDQRRLAELAAAGQNLSEHLLYVASDYVRRNARSGARSPVGLVETATQLRDQTLLLHRAVSAGNDVSYLRQHTERLNQTWSRVLTTVALVDVRDRAEMDRLAGQLTPILVELQTMLSF